MSKDDAAAVAFSATLGPFTDTLRLFERGTDTPDYTAFNDDARKAAVYAYRSESSTRRASDNKTPMTTVNRNLLGTLLKAALEDGLKIQIYAPEGKKFALKSSASPGNISQIEDLVGEQSTWPVVAAVRVKKSTTIQVGVAFSDVINKTLGLVEFEDNEAYGNLEALMIQLGVREVLVESADEVAGLVSRNGVLVTTVPKGDFSGGKEEVLRLSGLEEMRLGAELGRPLACAGAAALSKFLTLTRVEIVQHDLSQFMRLDGAALKALNVLPSARDQVKSQSLYGLLNRCCTASGSRMLSQWLKQPLLDLAAINERHNQVEALVNAPGVRTGLRSQFALVPDMTKIVRKFQRGFARLDDVVRIYQLAIMLPEFTAQLSLECLKEYGAAIEHAHTELQKLQELVVTTVDMSDHRDYVVRSDFDERLVDLKAKQDALLEQMREMHAEHAENLGMERDKKLKFEDTQNHGWCYRLTRNDASILRSKSGYIELATLKAGVYFTTSKLKAVKTEWENLKAEYSKTQSALVAQVVSVVSTYLPVLSPLGEALSKLDVLCAFAEAASFAPVPYIRPQMHAMGTGSTRVKAARHPCMEAQDNLSFIPNDIMLERGRSEFLIITGPNMGGKSTYIRQIGVINLMAQIGCFVPAAEAEITVVDCILARVGAGDSQLKGISTFMAEMLETASILKTATKNSLIVIDELGRGTSTYDGFGLAWAISQHIIEHIGCFSMFATHFHELTALAKLYPSAHNLHAVADVAGSDDITLLYKIAEGISDKSFGIHVAEVVQFPQKVINMAKRKAEELETVDNAEFGAEEIKEGNETLTRALKKWIKESDPEQPEAAVGKLRGIFEENKAEFEQPFLKSLLGAL